MILASSFVGESCPVAATPSAGWGEERYNILSGDSLTMLKTLPDESVQCCVTSPPYFGLRDYGHDGQIGLEPTPDEFVAALVAVFQEVKRVLKKDGTCWLNLGDSYAGSGKGPAGNLGVKNDERNLWKVKGGVASAKIPEGTKPKDLIGIPWRVAFALQADGWYLRQDIIRHKPNPMPESVKDRCTKAHEYIFLLTKSGRYYFDADAMREPVAESQKGRQRNDKFGGKSWVERNQHSEGGSYNTRQSGASCGTLVVLGERGDGAREEGAGGTPLCQSAEVARPDEPSVGKSIETRNKRSVWTVTTKPYSGAHFATYPPDLIRPCILAGSPAGGLVLDPFAGSGTTGMVCMQEDRRFLGIELNPANVKLCHERITTGK